MERMLALICIDVLEVISVVKKRSWMTPCSFWRRYMPLCCCRCYSCLPKQQHYRWYSACYGRHDTCRHWETTRIWLSCEVGLNDYILGFCVLFCRTYHFVWGFRRNAGRRGREGEVGIKYFN
ncbi:unnamed protein product, partial [Hapterophycus canaliculatus]